MCAPPFSKSGGSPFTKKKNLKSLNKVNLVGAQVTVVAKFGTLPVLSDCIYIWFSNYKSLNIYSVVPPPPPLFLICKIQKNKKKAFCFLLSFGLLCAHWSVINRIKIGLVMYIIADFADETCACWSRLTKVFISTQLFFFGLPTDHVRPTSLSQFLGQIHTSCGLDKGDRSKRLYYSPPVTELIVPSGHIIFLFSLHPSFSFSQIVEMATPKLWMVIFFSTFCTATLNETCRCFPGDGCWPSELTWRALNSSVHGRLVATVPLGAPCHDPTYNSDICDNLQKHWLEPVTQWEHSHLKS